MKVLSLFSGGGLGDYGLELAGMEIVGQVEIDDYCQKILKLRWPEVPKWRDVRAVHTKENHVAYTKNRQQQEQQVCDSRKKDGRKTQERFIARTSCGSKVGCAAEGSERPERTTSAISETFCPDCLNIGPIDLISGGFPCQDISQAGRGAGIKGERSGLWKEMHRIICEVRPRYVLVENVSALLGRGLGTVLGDLAESGYDAEWDCIPASSVGAPHQRDRVWIVAYPNECRHIHGQSRIFSAERRRKALGKSWASGPLAPILRDSAIARLPDWAGGAVGQPRPLTEFERPNGPDVGDAVSHAARCAHGGKIGKRKRGRKKQDIEKGREVGRHASNASSPSRRRFREIERDFCGVAHGVANRVDRLKLLGNGQVVQVVQWIGERIMDYDKSSTTKGEK